MSDFDYHECFGILAQLKECKNRKELKSAFKSRLLPFFECSMALIGWTDSRRGGVQIIECSGFKQSDYPLIKDYLNYDPVAKLLLTEKKAISRSNNSSNSSLQMDEDEDDSGNSSSSFSENPDLGYGNDSDAANDFFNQMEKPFTIRDLKFLELMRPHLLHLIKNLMIKEELAKYKSATEALANTSKAIALLSNDLRVLFFNEAFKDLFHLRPNQKVTQELASVFQKENNKVPDPDDDEDENKEVEIPFFTLGDGIYKLTYTQLIPEEKIGKKFWLLGITPATDPYTKMNTLMQKSGLTWREMEIGCLIHDGLGKNEIAARLFISPDTVRTHLKKIHKKLGVNNRTQLVAFLNQHADR